MNAVSSESSSNLPRESKLYAIVKQEHINNINRMLRAVDQPGRRDAAMVATLQTAIDLLRHTPAEEIYRSTCNVDWHYHAGLEARVTSDADVAMQHADEGHLIFPIFKPQSGTMH